MTTPGELGQQFGSFILPIFIVIIFFYIGWNAFKKKKEQSKEASS